MPRLVAGLALSAMLATPSVADAATKYVRKAGGLDTNDCSQPSPGAGNVGPCLTIGKAVTVAMNDDTIDIGPASSTRRSGR